MTPSTRPKKGMRGIGTSKAKALTRAGKRRPVKALLSLLKFLLKLYPLPRYPHRRADRRVLLQLQIQNLKSPKRAGLRLKTNLNPESGIPRMFFKTSWAHPKPSLFLVSKTMAKNRKKR